PLAASAWGAANALALEFPTVRWACLDVERLSDLEYWAQIELPAAEDRVALRHDEIFGLRWRRAPLGHPRLDLSALDVVLVSGGTGGVGAQLCHALREAGVAQVIALSRRPASVGEAGIEHLQVD